MQGHGRPGRATRRGGPGAGGGVRALSSTLVHELRVRYAECDPQGVVFNSRYLEYFDIGLTELWREALGSYDGVMVEHGVDIVVAEATVRYHAPLRFDDLFDVRVALARLGTTAMTTGIELLRGPDLVAEGELRHVFVGRVTATKTTIPYPIRAALQRYVQGGAQLSP
ncbi:MAG: acyl-CoA thioesterase [Actinomycetota bacterium]|nr:acyl-CoA thioesterase [Actinomycetota bacterium]